MVWLAGIQAHVVSTAYRHRWRSICGLRLLARASEAGSRCRYSGCNPHHAPQSQDIQVLPAMRRILSRVRVFLSVKLLPKVWPRTIQAGTSIQVRHMPNKRMEFARTARPPCKGDAPLLAAYARRLGDNGDGIVSRRSKKASAQFAATRIRCNRACFPKASGVYGWFVRGKSAFRPFKVANDGLIYVGMAADLARRELMQHLRSDKTGGSSLRRSVGGILQKKLKLVAIPRSESKTDSKRFSHYLILAEDDEARTLRQMGCATD